MKRKLCALVLGTLLFTLTACGASGNKTMNMATDEMPQAYSVASGSTGGTELMAENGAYDSGAMEAKPEEDAVDGVEVTRQEATSRKLIKTVNMEVETKEYDQFMTSLEAQIDTLGGYIESMDAYNGSTYSNYRSNRNAYLRIRIPENQLDSFLDNVTDISNVIRRSDMVEDITLQYVDTQSHRDSLRTEQNRLLELMEQAENIEDIIAIEERLSDIRYQLESMESKLRTMDNQVSYSTVCLDITEVRELTPVSEETTIERITNGFVNSLKNIGSDLKETGIWIIIKLPYLIIWGIVITLAVLIIRKVRRNKVKRPVTTNKDSDKADASEEQPSEK